MERPHLSAAQRLTAGMPARPLALGMLILVLPGAALPAASQPEEIRVEGPRVGNELPDPERPRREKWVVHAELKDGHAGALRDRPPVVPRENRL